jgi:hypothetical protein
LAVNACKLNHTSCAYACRFLGTPWVFQVTGLSGSNPNVEYAN